MAKTEKRRHEEAATAAKAARDAARGRADAHMASAVGLRESAKQRRTEKQYFPETDGKPAQPVGTFADLKQAYDDANRILNSKREAQQAKVADQLTGARDTEAQLKSDYEAAREGVPEHEIAVFEKVFDIERAIADARRAECSRTDDYNEADKALSSANGYSGRLSQMIEDAGKRGVAIMPVHGFEGASSEACYAEQKIRESQRDEARLEVGLHEEQVAELARQVQELRDQVNRLDSLIQAASYALPADAREALPDLSLDPETFKATLDSLVGAITAAKDRIQKLTETAEGAFERARGIFTSDQFRRLEPQWADLLNAYSARQAGANRQELDARLQERIGIVREQIETHRRDEQLCLDHLRQHVNYADDLIRRAMRASRIPAGIPEFGGKEMLKVKKTLRDVSADVVQHQLGVYLTELASLNRLPKDGAKLAAETLHRIHGGTGNSSVLGIEVLKPKRDAIEPYMRVDRLGFSGGEGVTLAMMLYTVIQKMAMDERVDGRAAHSGGFLILDNTFGKSNLIDHVKLQLMMAARLGIQLLMTASAEDKHVIDMFPSVSRMVQGRRVLVGGVPQYVPVRAADYQLKDPGYAA